MTRLAGGMQSQFHNTSYHECEGGIEKSVPLGSSFVISDSASLACDAKR